MSVRTQKSTQELTSNHLSRHPGILASLLQSPWLWGSVGCFSLYAVIDMLPVYQSLADRYFRSHPLEYVTTFLFCVGIAILLIKAIGLRKQASALSPKCLSNLPTQSSADTLTQLQAIDGWETKLPRKYQQTYLVDRVRDVAEYVRGRQSADNLEEHLRYLAELASDHLHRSYALVRTVTWAVPILGFLGTVIGITIAIANVTPEQLDTSLGEVTGGLAVAFDTTALALGLSIVLVFSSFATERAEQKLLADVEDFGIRRLACLFPQAGSSTGSLAAAEVQASQHLLDKTEAVVQWQVDLWKESLETLRASWTETLANQQGRLDESLREGVDISMTDHRTQLAEVRNHFLDEFRSTTQEVNERQLEQTEKLIVALNQSLTGWKDELRAVHESNTKQTIELAKHTQALSQIVENEAELTRLQGRLAENLEAIRAAESMDETLHSLNAAVHLLTARVRSKAA